MKRLFFAALSGCLITTAAMADITQEIEIAQDHAGLAVKASDIAGVKMHLHHTINCLVGPGGPGFDTRNANPCAKAGKGALQDNPSAAQSTALHAAAVAAGRGLATDDLAKAQAAAKETADTISIVN